MMMSKGTVLFWNNEKGHGYLSCEEFPYCNVYVHWTSIAGDGPKTLKEEQCVTYDLKTNRKALCATKALYAINVVPGALSTNPVDPSSDIDEQ